VLAGRGIHAETKRTLKKLVSNYELLAQRAEQRLGRSTAKRADGAAAMTRRKGEITLPTLRVTGRTISRCRREGVGSEEQRTHAQP
jgi:hypothetical protein